MVTSFRNRVINVTSGSTSHIGWPHDHPELIFFFLNLKIFDFKLIWVVDHPEKNLNTLNKKFEPIKNKT